MRQSRFGRAPQYLTQAEGIYSALAARGGNETVEAEIVLSSPEAKLDPIHAFCREHLASYKIPTRFTVVAVLPRTPVTGKILRAAPVA